MVRMLSNFPALFFVSLQFLLPWLALCSKRPCAAIDIQNIQLTGEYLNDFALHLTGGSADPCSVRLPADLAAKKHNSRFWMKYIIGSVAVLGSIDKCALSVIYGLWRGTGESHFLDLLKALGGENDRDAVAHYIAENTGGYKWDCEYEDLVTGLVKKDWDAMRPLFEMVLSILKEREAKSKEYGAMVRCMPIELQYERIRSGQAGLDEIDKVYLFDKPLYSLLREMFFRAGWSPTPSPQVREHIAKAVPWFSQFMPEDIPSNAKGTCVDIYVDPGHDVWTHIRSFMDIETLIFACRLVCRPWSKSHITIITKHMRANEDFLQDLRHAYLGNIHTIAPWSRFIGKANSAEYLGQCILNGALGRVKLNEHLDLEVGQYLAYVMKSEHFIIKASQEGTPCRSFAKLISEGYKASIRCMPDLMKPAFLSDKEYDEVIRDLVFGEQLAVELSCEWIISNIPRIYLVLGTDQVLIKKVIDASTVRDPRGALFIWIMIAQECDIAEDTAKLVFDKPGTFTQKFIRPVPVKPKEYFAHIADSGMLFEMIMLYENNMGYEKPCTVFKVCELRHLMISLVLFFKNRPEKIEKIVASIAGQLPTLDRYMVGSIKDWLGISAMHILTSNSKYPSEDVEFIRGVLEDCGLLDRPEV